MMGALGSVLYERVLPADNSLALDSGSAVTVPFFGLGIKPLGPRILAKRASFGMSEGLAKRISKFI